MWPMILLMSRLPGGLILNVVLPVVWNELEVDPACAVGGWSCM